MCLMMTQSLLKGTRTLKFFLSIFVLFFVPSFLFAQSPGVTNIPSPNPSLSIYNDHSVDDLITMAICAGKKIMGSDCSRLSKEEWSLILKDNRAYIDGLFERALDKVCQKDVRAAINNLKLRAHFCAEEKMNNPLSADCAFYYSLAIIKYLTKRDEANQDPNLAPLREGYKEAAIKNVSDAIMLHSNADYVAMQKQLFEALLIVYPVTSSVPLKQQSTEIEWNSDHDPCSPELNVGPAFKRRVSGSNLSSQTPTCQNEDVPDELDVLFAPGTSKEYCYHLISTVGTVLCDVFPRGDWPFYRIKITQGFTRDQVRKTLDSDPKVKVTLKKWNGNDAIFDDFYSKSYLELNN